MSDRSKTALIILDGWGQAPATAANAIAQAKTPFHDRALKERPNATLLTDGEHVGLPAGQMGNSEVGHLNIGAGRIVYQDLLRIDHAVAAGTFLTDPVLHAAFAHARTAGRKLHFMGLVGHGGVHAMQRHLVALCKAAAAAGVERSFIHAFTDGRDSDPKAAASDLEQLQQDIAGTNAHLASLCGRYYAMDRDKRWERVRKAYDLLVHGRGQKASDAVQAVRSSYANGITDEFLEPTALVDPVGDPIATIAPGDVLICFNYRTDRCREITQALTQQAFPEQGMEPLPLYYVTATQYDASFKNVHVIFHKDDLQWTLGEAVAAAGKRQLRIAETEKYPHVTFFFSGGREQPFPGEERALLPSPKVATYDLQPGMNAEGIADAACKAMEGDGPDLLVLNFANPDMVGHTGVFPAIVDAVETTDRCAERVVNTALANGYSCVVIADHGNADMAVNPDGTPNTAHTTNPVPVIVFADGVKAVRPGILADVAPTLLDLLDLEKPVLMTGSSLLVR